MSGRGGVGSGGGGGRRAALCTSPNVLEADGLWAHGGCCGVAPQGAHHGGDGVGGGVDEGGGVDACARACQV